MEKYFNGVLEDNILRFDGKIARIAGKEVPVKEWKELCAEARTLKEIKLWQHLMAELKYLASERMFNKSQNWEDMIAGKMMLYAVSIIENRVNKLATFE